MTIYFYDDKQCALIALDTETLHARVLSQAVLGTVPAPLPAAIPAGVLPPPKAPKATPSVRGRKKTIKCSKCGESGHNAKTCGKAALRKSQKSHPWRSSEGQGRERMSQMTFGRVKISQSHDIPAETIARNLGLDVAEVEKAFEAETYADYTAL